MSSHKRKLSNFMLQPLLQIRLGFYNILLSLAFCLALVAIFYVNFNKFYDLVLELTDLREEVTDILRSYVQGLVGWVAIGTTIYFFITVAVSVFFTHRLVGPTYAFRRHIRELKNGNYGSRVVLRKGDAFQEVAEDLNDLAVTLEQVRRRSS
jgi:signal transduction histidine kinase